MPLATLQTAAEAKDRRIPVRSFKILIGATGGRSLRGKCEGEDMIDFVVAFAHALSTLKSTLDSVIDPIDTTPCRMDI